MPIVSQTKDNGVYQQLRERILRNNFRPGEWLREEDLCRQLGVTRTPLRLALRRLEHERLLVGEPYRGCRVRELRGEEIEPLFDMREVLEGLAARNVAAAGDSAALAKLQKMAQLCDDAMQDEEWVRYFEHDKNFHWELVVYSGNEKLIEVMEVCDFQLRTFALHDRYLLRVVEQLRAKMHRLKRNHQDLVQSLATGDADAAETRIRRHIRASRETVLHACRQWQLEQNINQ